MTVIIRQVSVTRLKSRRDDFSNMSVTAVADIFGAAEGYANAEELEFSAEETVRELAAWCDAQIDNAFARLRYGETLDEHNQRLAQQIADKEKRADQIEAILRSAESWKYQYPELVKLAEEKGINLPPLDDIPF